MFFYVPSLHQMFDSICFKLRLSVVQYDPFLRCFVCSFCFHELVPLVSNMKTKPQLAFAASVLKDISNFLPGHFSTIWSLFLWETGFSIFQEDIPLQKATRSSLYL